MPKHGFKRIADRFEVNLDREVGRGGFGVVYKCVDLSQSPPEDCAAKCVTFTFQSPSANVKREVEVMRAVGPHSSIIQLLEYVPSQDSAWLFLEMASGGELFDRLIDSGSLSERATRPYAAALIAALHHCHSKGVIHRDVKLENVLLCAEDPHAVKLIDFGLAVTIPPGQALTLYDGVGSKSYKSPELFSARLNGYLAPPVDVWALGITVFSLLAGFFPFDQAKQTDWRFARFSQDQARGVGACDSLFASYNRSCGFSAECKQMVDSMLQIDAARRPPMSALLQHPWATKEVEEFSSRRGDENVYRGGGLGEEESDEAVAGPPPENSVRITRQRAAVASDGGD